MNLLRDPADLARLIDLNAPAGFLDGIDAAEWLSDPRHFALAQGDDLALFEVADEWPGPLCAHVLFASRGKAALETARTMLDQAFAFGATRIVGEVPAHFRHSLLFVRWLGFAPYGEAELDGERLILLALVERPNTHPTGVSSVP